MVGVITFPLVGMLLVMLARQFLQHLLHAASAVAGDTIAGLAGGDSFGILCTPVHLSLFRLVGDFRARLRDAGVERGGALYCLRLRI